MTTVCDAGVYEQGVWLLRASATLLIAALIGRTGLNKISVEKSVEMTRIDGETIAEAQVVPPTPTVPEVPAADAAPPVESGVALVRRRPFAQQKTTAPRALVATAAAPTIRGRNANYTAPRAPGILGGVTLQRTATAPQTTATAPVAAAATPATRGRRVNSGTPLHIKMDQKTLKNVRFTL